MKPRMRESAGSVARKRKSEATWTNWLERLMTLNASSQLTTTMAKTIQM